MWVLFGLMVLKEGYMVVMGLLFFRKGKMLNLKIS
jgi:cardiolipin synthase